MTAKRRTEPTRHFLLVWISASIALNSVINFFSPAAMDPPDVSGGVNGRVSVSGAQRNHARKSQASLRARKKKKPGQKHRELQQLRSCFS